jgi:signal peptidase I
MEDTILPEDRVIVKRSLRNIVSESRLYKLFRNRLNSAGGRNHSEPFFFRNGSKVASFSTLRNELLLIHVDKYSYPIIKRCIGLPGDTLMLSKSLVSVNGHLVSYCGSLKNKYCAITSNRDRLVDYLIKSNVEYDTREYYNQTNRVYFIDSEENVKRLIESILTDSIFMILVSKEIPIESVFYGIEGWSLDVLGPIVIPSRGMELDINEDNIGQYRHLLEFHEGLNKEDIKELVDGELKHKIIHNYFFLLGDNRNFSEDSRHFGFLPESRIIGRTDRVLFSLYNNKFTWERLLMRIE